ncbi:DNA-binding transcriptional activator EvgA [Escherichia coli]|uniref:DNA-binding transcriptional activator EvgA n=1 Tax=Escherichia coli TaxID=562 RepID=A0A377CAS9_ECOLX|nr:DNA-binding transcriptional activator EvgA [Escherichia coli]
MLETLRKRQYSGIIIIVSAKNDHFYGKHCADAGANGFVSKKEGMNNIIAAIEAAKNGYCYFPFSLNRFVGSLTSDQQKLDSLSKQEISVMRIFLMARIIMTLLKKCSSATKLSALIKVA